MTDVTDIIDVSDLVKEVYNGGVLVCFSLTAENCLILFLILQRKTDQRVFQKNVQIECCWSQGAGTPSPVGGSTWAWKVFFGRFLLRLRQGFS